MASIRNISVVLSANVSGYTRSIQTAAAATTRLSEAMAQANAQSQQAGQTAASAQTTATAATNQQTQAVQQQNAVVTQNTNLWNGFRRGQGVSLNMVGRYRGATSAAAAGMQAWGTATTFTGRAMQMLSAYATQAMSVMAGFLAVHLAITSMRKLYSGAKDAIISFNSAVTESTAILDDQSTKTRKSIEDASLAIAQKYSYSAAEAAQSVFYLASAGLSAQQSVAAIPVVTAFASAGVMDLAKSSKYLMDAQTALDLRSNDTIENMKEMTRVSDVLVKANIMSNATTEQFAQALTNKAAAAARLLGKDIEETTAVLAAFASQGIKGRTAGERLNIAWRDLQTRAIKNSEVFAQFGVAVYDTSGEMRNTADIIQDLEGALRGMSDEQKRATLMMMGFQDRSVMAIMSLIGTSSRIREYERALHDAGGETEKVANRQMKSFSNQLKLLRNDFQQTAIRAGQAFQEFAGILSDKFGPVLANIIAITKDVWNAFAPLVKIFAVIAGSAVVATLTVIGFLLEKVTGFLRDHSYIVTILASLYAARFASSILVGEKALSLMAGALGGLAKGVDLAIAGGTMLARGFMSVGTSVVTMIRGMAGFIPMSQAMGEATVGLRAGLNSVSAGFATLAGTAATAEMAVTGVLLVIGFFAYAWMDAGSKAKAAAKDIQDAVDAANTPVEMRVASADAEAATQKSIADMEKWHNEHNVIAKDWTTLGRSMNVFGNAWTAIHLDRKIEALSKAQEEASIKSLNFATNVQKVAQATNFAFTGSFIRDRAKELGVDLTKALSESGPDRDKLIADLKSGEQHLGLMGLSAKDLKGKSEEAILALIAEGEAVDKAFAKSFDGWVEPLKLYQEEVKKAKEAIESFTTSTQIFSDLQAASSDAIKKKKQDEIDTYNEGIDDQIAALEEQATKEKQQAADRKKTVSRSEADMNAIRADGTKASKAASRSAQDDATETSRKVDATLKVQKKALERQKKSMDDVDKATLKGTVSYRSWLDGVTKAAKATDEWNANLKFLSEHGAADVVVSALRDMKEDGIPLVQELVDKAKKSPDEFKTAIEEANASIAKLGKPDPETIQVSLDALGKQVKAQAVKKSEFFGNIIKIGAEMDPATLAKLGMSAEDVMKNLASLGPEFYGAIGQLAGESSEDVNKFVADFVGAQKDISAITVDTFKQASALAVAATKANAAESVAGIIKELGLLPPAVAALRAQFPGLTLPTPANAVSTADWNAMDPETQQIAAQQGARPMTEMEAAQAGVPYTAPVTAPPPGPPPAYTRSPIQQSYHVGKDTYQAQGGIVRFWAAGGENHKAQVARAGDWRVWAEPETGGEAYIPLAQSKRAGSMRILEGVANEFGYSLQKFAWGGMTAGAQMGSGRPLPAGTSAPKVVVQPVAVPISKETNYNFGDLHGMTMDEIQRTAERKARTANLTGIPT